MILLGVHRNNDNIAELNVEVTGNILLNLLVDAQVYLLPRVPYLTGLLPAMQKLQSSLKSRGNYSAITIRVMYLIKVSRLRLDLGA